MVTRGDWWYKLAVKKRALVLLAPGAEEMETTIIVDVLRRAEVEVVLAGLEGNGPVRCSRGVQLVPDASLDEQLPALERGEFEAVILPGGAGGADKLAASAVVGRVLSRQWEAGRVVAAMCAAPLALAAHGIATGATVTCFPSLRARVEATHVWRGERVVRSGQLTTSQGPGTTFEFALALVEQLAGSEVAARVRAPLLLPS